MIACRGAAAGGSMGCGGAIGGNCCCGTFDTFGVFGSELGIFDAMVIPLNDRKFADCGVTNLKPQPTNFNS